MRDWENAYEKMGEIQTKVTEIVINAVNLLKKRNAKKVLDLCFGTGRHTIYLAENGFEVYGIDISKTGKQITEKKVKDKKLNDVHLKIADMHDIPFTDNFFDAIFSIYALEHNTSEGLKQSISELKRVLKPRGIIIANLISIKDLRFRIGEQVDCNTFIDINDTVEADVMHHFSDEKEINSLFSGFTIIDVREKAGFSERRKMKSMYWEITAEKK